MDSKNDQDVVIRCQFGEEIPIADFVQETSGMVYKTCWRILRSDLAEDTAQDTYKELHKQNLKDPNYFKHKDHLKGWLVTVAQNKARDHLRKLIRERERTQPLDPNDHPPSPVDPPPDPGDEEEKARETTCLYDCASKYFQERRQGIIADDKDRRPLEYFRMVYLDDRNNEVARRNLGVSDEEWDSFRKQVDHEIKLFGKHVQEQWDVDRKHLPAMRKDQCSAEDLGTLLNEMMMRRGLKSQLQLVKELRHIDTSFPGSNTPVSHYLNGNHFTDNKHGVRVLRERIRTIDEWLLRELRKMSDLSELGHLAPVARTFMEGNFNRR